MLLTLLSLGFGLALGLLLFRYPPIGLVDMVPLIRPRRPFEAYAEHPAPDYDQESSWFLRPPTSTNLDADVFFVHRTSYLSSRHWNAAARRGVHDRLTFDGSVKAHAAAFRGVGRVFAPKYRQATLYSFYDSGHSGARALDLAYADVRRAFETYLRCENRGRPIILAGHSQGTHHLERLIRELFDSDPELRARLVCAYLVAMPIRPDSFRHVPPARSAGDFGCFVSFSTFGHAAQPRYFVGQYERCVCVNPLDFDAAPGEHVPRDRHLGSLSYLFNWRQTERFGATVEHGVVHIDDPGFGYPRMRRRDYVVVDYHLFNENIRQNAALRLARHRASAAAVERRATG